MTTKYAAWGKSKLLEIYVVNGGDIEFEFVIDRDASEDRFFDIPIVKPSEILQHNHGDVVVVIFEASNKSLREIFNQLCDKRHGI